MRSLNSYFAALALACLASAGHADTPQIGAFTVTYTTAELLGEAASRTEDVFPADETITWEVYVPAGYRPDQPAGLLVFVSPTTSGRMPGKWRKVMDEKNLIWISANKSGNRVVVARRMLFAVLAILVAERNYAVDTERLYVSGFSGGGKVASRLATAHSETFTGGFFIGGVEVWTDTPPPGADGMKSNRYVFLCGSNDQALRSCRQADRAYRENGIENGKLMIIHGMGHKTPDRPDFATAIAFLDASSSGAE